MDQEIQIEEHKFPCPECGADLRYSPRMGALDCDHCGHHEEILAPPSNWQMEELELQKAFENAISSKQYEVNPYVHCNSCGANIEFGQFQTAKECPYCASPIVLETKQERQLRPQGILPFLVDQARGHELLSTWLGQRWFAPNGLAKFARSGRRLNGIYMPYWTFDADTKTQYSGQRGDIYYVTRGSGKNQRTEMRIRWSRRSGRVARFFDDVLIAASSALPRNFLKDLAPWDLSAVEPYNPEFLAGFNSEAYSVTLEDGWHEAQEVIKNVIIRDIKFDIGGDRQQIHQMQTQMKDMSFKYIQLPVYSLAYKFRGKTYRCLINGQTGRVTGERPFSWIKITLAIIAVMIITLVLFYFYETSGGGY